MFSTLKKTWQMYIFSTDNFKLLRLNKFRKKSNSNFLLAFLQCKYSTANIQGDIYKMMGKDSTTSKLDFLLLEEVSNEAAEAISGGQELTLGGSQELSLGLFDPITMPIDMATSLLGSIGELTGALGITLPDIGSIVSPVVGSLPSPTSLLPTDLG